MIDKKCANDLTSTLDSSSACDDLLNTQVTTNMRQHSQLGLTNTHAKHYPRPCKQQRCAFWLAGRSRRQNPSVSGSDWSKPQRNLVMRGAYVSCLIV